MLLNNKSRSRKFIFLGTALSFLGLVFIGCKKFVQVGSPISAIDSSNVFGSNASAASVMTGVYSNMVYRPGIASGNLSVSFLEGLASDELNCYTAIAPYSQFYKNALSSATSGVSNKYYWAEIYQEIHVADAEIEGLAQSTGVGLSMKQQLDGEAKFIRAFYLFYAVNLYGDVPVVTTTDYLPNSSIKRTPKTDVYKQIINDLQNAQAELSTQYVDANGAITAERIRPNKGVAEALLARVYLYTGDWKDAETEADSVINNTSNYALLGNLNQVFKKNSQEAIWQLPSVNPTGYNTWDAYYFVLTSPPSGSGVHFVSLSNNLINAFDSGDNRRVSWIGTYKKGTTSYYYPFKYQDYKANDPLTEYLMVFRLGEQYLIRAEARAQQNNTPGAQADLNLIRTRANLPNTLANDQASLLSAILHERQVELFTEWGHRWFDLIRTGSIDTVMSSPGNVCQAKGGNWNHDWTLAPLPLSELQLNPNLAPQNPGY